jgi:putative hydrolase of the HAD superfamily
MSKYSVALFDVDGVLNRPKEFFSQRYAREHGIDPEKLETFFDDSFEQASLGKRDLLEVIVEQKALWQWDQDPQLLLDDWFAAENASDHELLAVVARAKASGIEVYLATQQEAHRAQFIRDVMYPGLFDGAFMTCELGVPKHDPAFYQAILDQLDAAPESIIYFDDRQNLVDLSRTLGIDGYLYDDPLQVTDLLGI